LLFVIRNKPRKIRILSMIIFATVLCLACDLSKVNRGWRVKNGGAYIGSDPAISPDGSKIVFGSSRTGLGDIYMVNIDGSNRKRLTDNPAYDAEPRFTPDGKKIVFVSERDNGYGHIYIMNSDGSDQHPLTRTVYADYEPAVSPDGTKIAFSRQVDTNPNAHWHTEIFMMNLDGTGEVRLTNNDEAEGSPTFSPDGEKILYHVKHKDWNFDLMIMNTDGSQPIRLLSNATIGQFSPDGRKILFHEFEEDRSVSPSVFKRDIYIADADGKNRIILTNDIAAEYPRFSPDGKKIIFLGNIDNLGNGQIMIMNLDGSGRRVVANN
jgi:Tol biopolymer transport system component